MAGIGGLLYLAVIFPLLWPTIAAYDNGLPNGTCFDSAIPEHLRKNLTTPEGESVPFTVLLAGWTSAQITSSVIEILLTEIMGYNIAIGDRPPASSSDSIYCMLGCSTWWNKTNRGCETRKITHHVMVESWYLGFPHILTTLAEMYQDEMPFNAGDMGYEGNDGGYLPAAPMIQALNTTGIPFEYYKNWDAAWFTPSDYFVNLPAVDTADFMKCSETTMHDNVTAYNFFAVTGDTGGVNITDEDGVKTYKMLCQDDYFWRPSSCRNDPSKCAVFMTGGLGWDIPHAPQRAAAYNMPFAIGVAASWSKYLEVPKKYKSAYFYWWTPDDSFIEMQPTKLIYPAYNSYAWSKSDYTTATAGIKVAKIVPKDLAVMAPDVVKLLGASLFDPAAVDSMMLNMKTNSLTREQAACAWIKDNDDRWTKWIPDPTKCDPGFGLYDEATKAFTAQRTTATTCRACLPGMLSKAYSDDSGPPTYICEACPAGQQQLGAGAMACDPCPLGTSKLFPSAEECALCPAGQYQDEEGAFQCKKCPSGTTTMILGMKSISGCGCKAGSIDVSDLNSPLRTAADCQACTAGLDCPTMSTVAALKAGVSPVGEEFTPKVIEGYFSTESKPIGMFKCLSPVECPGGKPDTCGGDRIGVPCGECPAQTYWAGSKCSGCTAWSAIGWILCIVLVFTGLVGAYYFMNSAVTAKASTLVSTTCAIGMMINMLQSLGIIGTMTVDWPVDIKGIWGFLQVFTFDIDGFAFACIAGENPVARYIGLVLFFPVGLLWLNLCGVLSKVKAKWAWDTAKLRSTMGQFMQVAFSTMSSTALVPYICYTHPNGLRSNLKYTNVFCSTDEHTAMVIAGSLLLAFGVCGFWGFAAWLAYMCPKWCSDGKFQRVQSARFLLGRFRLDVWWYGVPLLLRGPLLALTVVVAPDYPAVQVLGCQIILMTFMVVQIYNWPWKAPILNVVDMLVCFLFLILVAVAGFYVPAATGGLKTFFEIFNILTLSSLLGLVGVMIVACVLALFYRAAIGSQNELKIMTVGKTPPPSQVASDLVRQIASLVSKSDEQMTAKLAKLGVYDLQALQLASSILQNEVVDAMEAVEPRAKNSSRSTSRITSEALAPAPKKKAEPEPPKSELAENNEDQHADPNKVKQAVL